jgi:heme A synthase
MSDTLFEIHRGVGYVVALVVLVSALMAFSRAKDAREFSKGPYVGAMVLVDIQVLLGLVLYGVDGYWEADAMIAYVHPLLALGALGAGHALVGRARKQQMAVEAHRTAGRGLVIAFVLVLAAVVVATAF